MNGRINKLEQAIAPLIHLYQDWQANNLNDDDYLSLPEYIAQHSDDEALASVFEQLYAVYQDEVTSE